MEPALAGGRSIGKNPGPTFVLHRNSDNFRNTVQSKRRTWKEHLKHLQLVIDIVRKAGLTLNLKNVFLRRVKLTIWDIMWVWARSSLLKKSRGVDEFSETDH